MIWKVRPTPSRQIGARPQADDVAAVEPHDAGVGRELAVQHVEAGALAGAVGTDQRQQLAGVRRRRRRRATACTPPNALCSPSTCKHRRHARGLAPARVSAFRPPTRPCGKSSTISRITAPEHGPPELGAAGDLVAQPGEDRRADHRTGQSLDAAQQHHDQPVGRLGDRDGRGRDAALGEGIDGAGQARRDAPPARRPPTGSRARRCRSPRRAAANRGRRAARSRRARTARATAARCRRRRGRAPGSNRSSCRRARPTGQMPNRPLLPPVKESHWKTIDQLIWAKASVSMAR